MRNLNAPARLLRIHFIADARYTGALEGGGKWTGKAVWSDDITLYRERLLRELKLPSSTGPSKWILTEFEDRWPFAKATGDLYFSKNTDQSGIDTRSTFAPPPRDAGLFAAFIFLCAHRLRRRQTPSHPVSAPRPGPTRPSTLKQTPSHPVSAPRPGPTRPSTLKSNFLAVKSNFLAVEPPAQVRIQFWPIQSSRYSTLPRAAPSSQEGKP